MVYMYLLGAASAEAQGIHGVVGPFLAFLLDGFQALERVVLTVSLPMYVHDQHDTASHAAHNAADTVDLGHAARGKIKKRKRSTVLT